MHTAPGLFQCETIGLDLSDPHLSHKRLSTPRIPIATHRRTTRMLAPTTALAELTRTCNRVKASGAPVGSSSPAGIPGPLTTPGGRRTLKLARRGDSMISPHITAMRTIRPRKRRRELPVPQEQQTG